MLPQSSRLSAFQRTLVTAALVLAAQSTLTVGLAVSANMSSPSVCQTSACVALSAGVSSKMNLSADPCDDFYNYACGYFPINYKYDPDDVFKSVKRTDPTFFQNSFSMMRNQLRSDLFEILMLDWVVNSTDPDVRDLFRLTRVLFRSCTKWMRYRSMKNDTLAGKRFFTGLLDHLLEGLNPKQSNKTIESILARIVNTDVPTMFDVRVPISYLKLLKRRDWTKIKKASRVVITADPKQYKSKSDFGPYLEFFSTLNRSADLSLENQSSTFNRIIKEIQNYERFFNWTEGCTKLSKKEQYKIKDLDALSRCANPLDPFSWSLFFNELLKAEYDPNTFVDLKNPVRVINFVSYLKRKTTFRSEGGRLSSYHSLLVVDWLLSFARFLPNRLDRLWEEAPLRSNTMDKAAGGTVDACMKWTKDLMAPVVESMYQRANHAENFDEVQDLITLLQDAIRKSVGQQAWIASSTKEIILRKLKSLKHFIGFDVLSTDDLRNYYAQAISSFRAGKYSKSSEEKYFGRVFSIALSASARKKFNVLCSNDNSSVTAFVTLKPLTTNAYNYMRQNQIVFPMGILAPPMYHREYPDYMNLGGLGAVIGHEIGHAFDIKGHRMNEGGVRGDYWDNATVTEYLRRTDCVKARYGTFDLVPGVRHWSNTTLGNDIADIMGLRAAYNALQMLGDKGRRLRLPNLPADLTPEKLLFVQTAQSWCLKAEPEALTRRFVGIKHSPPHLRVRGMIMNSEDFTRVFQCRPGQAMNPPDKCVFW